MSEYKELYEEIKQKNAVVVEGLSFSPDIFVGKDTGIGEKYEEEVYGIFSMDKESHTGYHFPACFITPKGGYQVPICWDRTSRYELRYENGSFDVCDRFDNKKIFEGIHFKKRAQYYSKQTANGDPMKSVAQDHGQGAVYVCYSNECALKDKGEDCLFCNINATKATYGDDLGITWKNPEQIGETVEEAYKEGFSHVTITGGFVPERREVEYYLDVAEAITDHLGQDTFNGTVVVGAPMDFTVFAKYKEAGFSTIGTNMEVWNAKMFDYICPGKSRVCGDHDRWLEALKAEVDIFGRYNVRSSFVAGLETKESLLEGISYLVENGVIADPSQWNANMGSALEGHRTPEPDWHFDVQERTAEIYINNGISWEQLRSALPSSDSTCHDLFRLKQGIRIGYDGKEIA